jgi:tetratricopeptide (TPR) repeat protein
MSFRNRIRGAVAPCSVALFSLVFLASAEPPQPPPAGKLEEAQDLLADGKYSEAVKAFKEAEKLAGGSCIECRLGLARAFNKMGAYKEALKNVEAILAASSEKNDLIAAYNEQGVALVAMGGQDPKQLTEAEKAFRQVLELSGGKINSARFNLGYTLLRLSRDEEGVKVLKEYLEQDPKAESAETAKDLIANPLRARKRLVPEFELVTLAGDYLTTEDVRGKVLLLDFWGTWCPPCVAAIPSLRSMSRRMEGDPFVLLSVSTDSDEAALREFIAKEKMTWPQVWDKGHQFTRKCQVQGFPTYLLVNHEGEILFTASGWGEGIERELSMRISSAIRAAKKSAKTSPRGVGSRPGAGRGMR